MDYHGISPNPVLDRLLRCDLCGRRAVDPIFCEVDYDEVDRYCELCLIDLRAAFTGYNAIAYAVVDTGLRQTELNARGVH